MGDLSVAELVEIRERRVELHAGVPERPSESVDGHDVLGCAEDSLQLDAALLERPKPDSGGSDHALVAAIRLTRVVGQDLVLIDDLRIEERVVEFTRSQRVEVPGLQPGVKVFDILARHSTRVSRLW